VTAVLVAVGSVKGSPGTTSLALALAVCWPSPNVVMAECDPAGGDLGGRFGVADMPGLSGLVVDARRDPDNAVWASHSQYLRVGADVVVAPASGRQAAASVMQLARLMPASTGDLVVDVGRLVDGGPAWPLVEAADAVLVVSGVDTAAVDHTASFIHALAEQDHPIHERVSVVVVGRSRWPLGELTDVLRVPVFAMPYDRRSAAVLSGTAPRHKGWTRVGLPAAARAIALSLLRPPDARTTAAARATAAAAAGDGQR
jgi:MinD-like ATPase involved in chromosome partitioning or flagellar assembly